ncbi:MAG: transglutaminase-like domain-containing protein [Planctomycetes bacterium]|nr:transglutaminase-like domain-containing protein [Planctomycetota bacterium]
MRRTPALILWCAVAMFAAQFAATPTRMAADEAPRWYYITLNEVPVGWSCSLTKPIEGGFRTESQTRLRMAREKQILSMTTTAWIEEDAAGKPLRSGQSQTGGGLSVRVNWEWAEEGIRERRTQGASVTEKLLPAIAKEALPPAAALRAAQAARTAGKKDFTLLLLDPGQGVQPAEVRSELVGSASVPVNGKPVECTHWKSSGPLIPLGSEEWIDAAGEMVQSQTPTGLGVLRSLLCSETTAISALDDAKPPVEVMVASFVKVDPPLADVMKKRSVHLLVKAKKPPIMPLPQEGFQRVKRNPDGSFDVTIDLDRPAEPSLKSVAADAAFMDSSPMIDWKDPSVLALKESALAGAHVAATDSAGRSKLFQAAVASHITKKDLASAFASASETAQSKSGDCTEHAVLLAALLRADGIPSRVAAGLVWADFFAGERNVFAWHLWTQALIDGRWVDLDATLPANGESFHPGHLLLAVTPLRDAASDPAWTSLLTSMGNLSIEVRDGADHANP